MTNSMIEKVNNSIHQFTNWFSKYGETSYDHRSFFANPFTKKAKTLYYSNPIAVPRQEYEISCPQGGDRE